MTKINFSLAWKITSLLSFLMFVFYLSFYRNNIEKKEPILKSEKPSSLIAKPKKETIHKNILNKRLDQELNLHLYYNMIAYLTREGNSQSPSKEMPF